MPQYVQIRMVRPRDAVEEVYPVPALEEYFKFRCARTVIQFGAGMRFLTAPFHVFFCPDSFISNILPNSAIKYITEGIEPAPRAWPGLVLVLKLAGHGRYEYVNISKDDVQDVREFFGFFY